jgi:hypothetical protein
VEESVEPEVDMLRAPPPPEREARGVVALRPDAELLVRPDQAVSTLPPTRSTKELFVLTNRLSPFAVAMRVLVNLALQAGTSPEAQAFMREAGRAARLVGLRLRGEELRNTVSAPERRSTGWPVGPNVEKTLARFRTSFLLSGMSGEGPIVALGLAAVRDGHIHPTPDGLELARAPSPLLEECSGWTLGTEQQAILRRCILAMPGELMEVAFFLKALGRAGGSSEEIDRSAQERHPEWTANRLVAHRAALIGRLRELGVIELVPDVPGRLRLSDSGSEFYREVVAHVAKGANARPVSTR